MLLCIFVHTHLLFILLTKVRQQCVGVCVCVCHTFSPKPSLTIGLKERI